jgi:WD40 repeat protein
MSLKLITHKYRVECVAVCPFPASLLALGSHDTTVLLFRLPPTPSPPFATPRLAVLRGHTRPVSALTFTDSRGKSLFSSGFDGVVRVWRCCDDEYKVWGCVRLLLGHENWVLSLVAMGELAVLSGGLDNSVRCWEVAGEESAARWSRDLSSPVLALAGGAGFVAAGTQDGRVVLLSARDGAVVREVTRGSMAFSLCFSPDGEWLLCAVDNTVQCHAVSGAVEEGGGGGGGGRVLFSREFDEDVSMVAVSPLLGSHWAAISRKSFHAHVFSSHDATRPPKTLTCSRKNTTSCCFWGCSRLITAGHDGKVRVWSVLARGDRERLLAAVDGIFSLGQPLVQGEVLKDVALRVAAAFFGQLSDRGFLGGDDMASFF